MAQCKGTTRKGARCKRDASKGSDYCTIHLDQEVRGAPEPRSEEWDREALLAAALGFALVGALLFFRIKR